MPEFRAALRHAVNDVRQTHPFDIDAWVLLPDHLHCIWTLPDGDRDFSKRWGLIKAGVTKQMGDSLVGGAHPTSLSHVPVGDAHPTDSRIKKREGAIWQRRFWEHRIRDDDDMRRHVEYIHYNPVKHGLVKSPFDWEHSSFHMYVKEGLYNKVWGAGETLSFAHNVGNE